MRLTHFTALMTSALALCAPTLVFAEGGGIRNGGIGIQCGKDPIQVLEHFEAVHSGKKLKVASSRKEFFEKVLKRLRFNPEFAHELAAKLAAHGHYSEWATAEKDTQSFDDFIDYDIPVSCGLKQLAIFEDGVPKRVEAQASALSESESWILELHEAIYAIAYLKYGHTNPLLVRKLMRALIAKKEDSKAIASALDLFLSLSENRTKFLRDNRLKNLVGLFFQKKATSSVSTYLPTDLARVCPKAVIFEYDGEDGLIAYLFHSDPAVSKTSDKWSNRAIQIRDLPEYRSLDSTINVEWRRGKLDFFSQNHSGESYHAVMSLIGLSTNPDLKTLFFTQAFTGFHSEAVAHEKTWADFPVHCMLRKQKKLESLTERDIISAYREHISAD